MEIQSYRLRCAHCGKMHEEAADCFLLECDEEHGPALLRSEYEQQRFTVHPELPGLFRYREWLPVGRVLDTQVKPTVFRSERLAERLGLENLWFAFSGYWPERGGFMETCSFKELEAVPVCARLPEGDHGRLVVVSANNTGRAFLQLCSRYGVPALVIVPESALGEMWLTVEKHPEVKLAILQGEADYSDAIELAGRIAALEGYYPEGGVKNVARRDGMGTVVLAAVEEIGRVPDHYVQAIGSGAGAIGAWEMSRRLLLDGSYGSKPMKLHLVQNEPYAPIAEAWGRGSRELARMEEREAKARIGRLHSSSLSNRKPPYAVSGGVYDALRDSGGQTYAVTSEEALLAGWLFESLEGCDLDPAADVAVAGLVRAARQRSIGSGDLVLLNLTGGGRKRLALDLPIRSVQPDYVFSSKDLSPMELERQLHSAPAVTPA